MNGPESSTSAIDNNAETDPSSLPTKHLHLQNTSFSSLENQETLLETEETHIEPNGPGNSRMKSVFLIQGIGMQFPWNALISNPAFMKVAFPNTTLIDPIAFQNWISFTFMLFTLCTTVYCLQPVKAFTDKLRSLASLYMNLFVFVVLFLLACWVYALNQSLGSVGINHDAAFIFVLLLVVISGVSSAILQSHLFAQSAQIHPDLTTSLLIGQGLSGIAICLLQLLLGILKVGTGLASIIYYSTSILVLIICLVLYKQTIYNASQYTLTAQADSTFSSVHTSISSLALPPSLTSLIYVLKPYLFSIIVNFIVTLSIFPGLTSLIISNGLLNQTAYTALLFLTFNVGDTLGRTIPPQSLRQFQCKPYVPILVASLTRILFFPAFFMVPLSGQSSKLQPVLSNGLISIVLVFTMALSGGWIAKVCLADAPFSAPAHGGGTRALAGRIMTLGLLLGLTSGSLLGFWVVGS